MNEYQTLYHCKYLVQYHIIWCPKFRFDVVKNNVESRLEQILREIRRTYDYESSKLELMPDHVHIFVSVKPTIAPTEIVSTYKRISSIPLFKEFPSLKEFYKRSGPLWSKDYFVRTVGKVSSETVKRSIKEQKTT